MSGRERNTDNTGVRQREDDDDLVSTSISRSYAADICQHVLAFRHSFDWATIELIIVLGQILEGTLYKRRDFLDKEEGAKVSFMAFVLPSILRRVIFITVSALLHWKSNQTPQLLGRCLI
jgi:hypothetical protein